MSSWRVLTTALNVLESRPLGFSGLAVFSRRLVTPTRSREVGVAFDYRHTWVIPEASERSTSTSGGSMQAGRASFEAGPRDLLNEK